MGMEWLLTIRRLKLRRIVIILAVHAIVFSLRRVGGLFFRFMLLTSRRRALRLNSPYQSDRGYQAMAIRLK